MGELIPGNVHSFLLSFVMILPASLLGLHIQPRRGIAVPQVLTIASLQGSLSSASGGSLVFFGAAAGLSGRLLWVWGFYKHDWGVGDTFLHIIARLTALPRGRRRGSRLDLAVYERKTCMSESIALGCGCCERSTRSEARRSLREGVACMTDSTATSSMSQ